MRVPDGVWRGGGGNIRYDSDRPARTETKADLRSALARHYSDYKECISIYTVYIDIHFL